VIRHSFTEAVGVLRHRALVGLALAAALAVPIALGGLTIFLGTWLHPYLQGEGPSVVVNVLLRPDLGPDQRRQWIRDVAGLHPTWKIWLVPSGELATRLTRWFPYLEGILSSDNPDLVPTLVEVEADDPSEVSLLERNPEVLAVGPTSSVRRILQTAGKRVAAGLGGLTLVLLLAAALLAAVWTHLEMYRHSDEITIQRLVGATEAAVRGPFLAVISVVGVVAGLLGAGGTAIMAHGIQRMASLLGLPRPHLSLWISILQVLTATLLPLISAWIALARHAELDLD